MQARQWAGAPSASEGKLAINTIVSVMKESFAAVEEKSDDALRLSEDGRDVDDRASNGSESKDWRAI